MQNCKIAKFIFTFFTIFYSTFIFSQGNGPITIHGSYDKPNVRFALHELFYNNISESEINTTNAILEEHFLNVSKDKVSINDFGNLQLKGLDIFLTPLEELPLNSSNEITTEGDINLTEIKYTFDNFQNFTTHLEALQAQIGATVISIGCFNICLEENSPVAAQGYMDVYERIFNSMSNLMCCDGNNPINISINGNASGITGATATPEYPGDVISEGCNVASYNPILAALNGQSDGHEGSIAINTTQNWYFGADSDVPDNELDLETVLLHELMHMFFAGSRITENGDPFGTTYDPDDGSIITMGAYSPWDLHLQVNGENLIQRTDADPDSDCCYILEPNPNFSWPDDIRTAAQAGQITINGIPVCYGPDDTVDFGNLLSHFAEDCNEPDNEDCDPLPSSQYVLYREICSGENRRTLSQEEIELFCLMGFCINDQCSTPSCYTSLLDDEFQFIVDPDGASTLLNINEVIANDVLADGFDALTDFNMCDDSSPPNNGIIDLGFLDIGYHCFCYEIETCDEFCDKGKITILILPDGLQDPCTDPPGCLLNCNGNFENYLPANNQSGNWFSQSNNDFYAFSNSSGNSPDVFGFNENNFLHLFNGGGPGNHDESIYFDLSSPVDPNCNIFIKFDAACNDDPTNILFYGLNGLCNEIADDGTSLTCDNQNIPILASQNILCDNINPNNEVDEFDTYTLGPLTNTTGNPINFLLIKLEDQNALSRAFLDNIEITTDCTNSITIEDDVPGDAIYCPGDLVQITYNVCYSHGDDPTDVTLTPTISPLGGASVSPNTTFSSGSHTILNLEPGLDNCQQVTLSLVIGVDFTGEICIDLEISDHEGCNPFGDQHTTKFIVENEPEAFFTYSGTCYTYTFIGSYEDMVSWEISDGTTYGNQTTITHTFQNFGTYTVTYTVSNECGTSTHSETIIIEDLETDFDFEIDCEDLSVKFTPLEQNTEFTFTWDFGDSNTSSEYCPTHTYTENGTYQVSLTVYNGCDEDTFTQEVEIDCPTFLCSCPWGNDPITIGTDPNIEISLAQLISEETLPQEVFSGCLAVNGILVVDVPYYQFNSAFIGFEAGSELRIEEDSYLYNFGSTLKGCEYLWKGIVVESGGQLVNQAGYIADAQYATFLNDDAIFSSSFMQYANNHIGIFVPQSTTIGFLQSIIISSPIRGNNFVGGELLPSYDGWTPIPENHSYSGIEVNDLVELNLNSAYDCEYSDFGTNTFSNLHVGINSLRSTIIAQNANFQNMLPSNEGIINDRGIYLNQSELHFCQGSFTDMEIGIQATSPLLRVPRPSQLSLVSSAEFTDINVGIEMSYCPNGRARVDNCIFNDYSERGIHIFESSDSRPNITDCTFNNFLDDVTNRFGVVITEAGFVGYIRNNTFNLSHSQAGIYLIGGDTYFVNDNEINFNPSQLGAFSFGIFASDCEFLRMNDNVVNAPADWSALSFSYYLLECQNGSYSCNISNDNLYGLLFGSNCQDSGVFGNKMVGNDALGLYISSGASIGLQDETQNLWCEGSKAIADNFQEAQTTSPFIVNSIQQNNCLTNPPGSWFVPAGSDPLESCTGPVLNENENQRIQQTDISSVQGSHIGNYSEFKTWEGQMHLLNKLDNNPNLIGLSADIDQFYMINQSGVLQEFLDLRRSISSIFRLNESQQNILDQTRQNIDVLHQELSNNIELLDGEINENVIENLILIQDSLLNEVQVSLNLESNLLELHYDEVINKVQNLKLINSNLSDTEILKINEKVVNDIYLDLILEGELNSNQISDLIALANRCHYEDGVAVIKARGLLSRFDEHIEIALQESNCTIPSERINKPNEIQDEFIKIYPNPVQNEITLELINLRLDDIDYLELLSLSGISLLTLDHLENNTIEIGKLNYKGFVVLKILTKNNKSIVKKLIIEP